jgi:cell division transport system permease protein
LALMAGEFKVKKKKLGSYPFFSVVFSITLALFVIGLFGVLIIYSGELARLVKENVKIQVYLKNQLTDDEIKSIEKKLTESDFVLKNPKQKTVVFISKEAAARQFIRDTGEDFNFLGENPLRSSFLVNVDTAFQTKKKLNDIKFRVERIDGVFQVHYEAQVIEKVNSNIAQIGLVLFGVAFILLIVVVLLINSTLRLALFSQRFLIRSMQLVGATKAFIQWPFMLRAALHGALAGIVASGLLLLLIRYGHDRVEELRLVANEERIMTLLGSLLALGIFVAVISTWRAVQKYLRLSLDELY